MSRAEDKWRARAAEREITFDSEAIEGSIEHLGRDEVVRFLEKRIDRAITKADPAVINEFLPPWRRAVSDWFAELSWTVTRRAVLRERAERAPFPGWSVLMRVLTRISHLFRLDANRESRRCGTRLDWWRRALSIYMYACRVMSTVWNRERGVTAAPPVPEEFAAAVRHLERHGLVRAVWDATGGVRVDLALR